MIERVWRSIFAHGASFVTALKSLHNGATGPQDDLKKLYRLLATDP
jgi:hypothetical protein